MDFIDLFFVSCFVIWNMEMFSHDKHHSSLCKGCSLQSILDILAEIHVQSRDLVPHNKDSEDNVLCKGCSLQSTLDIFSNMHVSNRDPVPICGMGKDQQDKDSEDSLLNVIESNSDDVDQTSKLTTNRTTPVKKLTDVTSVINKTNQAPHNNETQVYKVPESKIPTIETIEIDYDDYDYCTLSIKSNPISNIDNKTNQAPHNNETQVYKVPESKIVDIETIEIDDDDDDDDNCKLCIKSNPISNIDNDQKVRLKTKTEITEELSKVKNPVEMETKRIVSVESEQEIQKLKELQQMIEGCPHDGQLVIHRQSPTSIMTAGVNQSISEFLDVFHEHFNSETKDCSSDSDLETCSFISNSTEIFPDHANLNSATLPIGVAYSRDRKPILEPKHMRTLFISNLDYRTTDKSLKFHFKQWGEIIDVAIKKQPQTKHSFGVVTYSRAFMVDAAQIARPHRVDGRVVKSKRTGLRQIITANVNNIYVGVPIEDIKENDLKDYFKMYGHIISCKIVADNETGKKYGFGLIEFDDYDPVDKICLQRFHVIKNKYVGVQKAFSNAEMHGNLGEGRNTEGRFEREYNQNGGNWRNQGGNRGRVYWNDGKQGSDNSIWGGWGNGVRFWIKQNQTWWRRNRGGAVRSNFNQERNIYNPYRVAKRRRGEYETMGYENQYISGNNLN